MANSSMEINGNINDENVIRIIEEYTKENGWSKLFSLLAVIAPETKSKEDLKENEVVSANKKIQVDVPLYDTVDVVQNTYASSSLPVKEASIYKEEHLEAVRADQNEKSMQLNSSKTRILEPTRKSPNPWGDAEIVLPGHLNL